MTFWQENYPFIKDVYIMRQTKMVEWMENVEKAISRIMADKVYTSAEFKRERDNFHVSAQCVNLSIFLSFRFYVRLILEKVTVLQLSFLPFVGSEFC